MIQARIRAAGRPRLDLDITCAAGLTALFGPRGSGKSLVLDCLAGLARPDTGRILVDDQILFDSGTGVNLPPGARPVGYIPRGCALFPHMTVRQNLLFAGTCRRLPKLERHRRANELIERFGLSACSGGFPAQATGSEKQRAVLARALVGKPRLLLMDGPTDGLDAPLSQEVYGRLREVRTELGAAVMVGTHALEDCFELGEEVLVLLGGTVAQTGSPREVIGRPAGIEAARALGGFNLLSAEIVALDPGRGSSRLRLGETDLAGPYFPGRFKGDRVTLCVRPEELTALAAQGKPGPNQVPAQLIRVAELAQSARLHFEGGITVEMPRADYEQRKHHREWVVEFPPDRLRVL